MTLHRILRNVVVARISDARRVWLDAACAAAAGASLDPLVSASAVAGARVGRTPLVLSCDEQAALRTSAADVMADPPLAGWTIDDVARTLLLWARRDSGRTGADFVADANAWYEQADSREQQSWVRAAGLWPEAPALLAIVTDACRTSIQPLFEAVACENPYPATHFPEAQFNQLVLKAAFNGIALNRIVGLARRLNPELSRMARDYAAERTAAGRSVPADLSLAIGPSIPAFQT